MRRILPLILLCAGSFLSTSALADSSNPCPTEGDTTVSFPDGSYDYIFDITTESDGSSGLCLYSPTDLELSLFTGASIADFNHDGWPDLLFGVNGVSGGEVQLFLNDKTGSGIVMLSNTLATGAAHAPTVVGSLDLNGDHRPDILTANGTDGTVSVMLNDGSGDFPSVKQYAAGSNLSSMAAVDLNGDHRPDIVAADYAGDAVDILLNTGTGDFTAANAIPVGAGPDYMLVQDIDHDGHPDIITGNVGDRTVSVLSGKGDGAFETPTAYPVAHLSFVSLIDTNNDGRLDIVTDFNWGVWYALVNNGDGTFATPAWVPMPGGGSSGGVTITVNTGGGLVTDTGTSTPLILGTSGSGKVTLPTFNPGTVTVTPTSGSGNGNPSAPTPSSGNGGGGRSHAGGSAGSGGGGAMEWFSLMLLGLTGFLRKKHT